MLTDPSYVEMGPVKVGAIIAFAISSQSFSPPSCNAPPRQKPPFIPRRTPPAVVTPGRRSFAAARLRSVPTSIDTITSGLASIARLPRGVTVSGGVSSTGPAAPFLPALKELYDIENDRDCRAVRERITELDLVVERVVPASPNSRAVEASATAISVPTLVSEVDGEKLTLSGVDDILNFFDEKFSTENEARKKEPEGVDDAGVTFDQLKDYLLDLVSYIPGILRAGRGSGVCSAASSSVAPPRPEKPLILYSYEGNQFCRLVREVLAELDIVYELRSCGKGSPRREDLASLTGGSSQCPYLIDPNTGVSMPESKDIVEYVYSKYSMWVPPSEILRFGSNILTPLLAPLFKVIAPLQAGSYGGNEFEYASDIAEAKAEIYDLISSRPVVIYTYELSPYCKEAMALLKNIGVQVKEVSLGKEWIPGLIEDPVKRAALLDMTGQSSLPHIFIGGTGIGGLYSGNPGLVPALEKGELMNMVRDAKLM